MLKYLITGGLWIALVGGATAALGGIVVQTETPGITTNFSTATSNIYPLECEPVAVDGSHRSINAPPLFMLPMAAEQSKPANPARPDSIEVVPEPVATPNALGAGLLVMALAVVVRIYRRVKQLV